MYFQKMQTIYLITNSVKKRYQLLKPMTFIALGKYCKKLLKTLTVILLLLPNGLGTKSPLLIKIKSHGQNYYPVKNEPISQVISA